MTSPDLSSGGNVKPPAATISAFRVNYLNFSHTLASDAMMYIKLAKRQGVEVISGAYEYSGRPRTLKMLNVTFQGPRQAVESLKDAILNLGNQ